MRGVKVLEGTVATVGESTGVTERVAERRALGDELFGMAPGVKGGQLGMNPFSLSTNTATGSQEAQVNPFRTQTASTSTTKSRPESSETYADRARSAPKPSPTPKKSGPPTEDLPSVPAQPYPSSFIDAEYESWAPPQKTDQAQGLRTDYERIERDSDEPATGKEDAQLFESAMDSTFQKFADRLASNPEQVLRYELGGQPLLYSHDDDVGKLLSKGDRAGQAALPSCSRCGSSRVVEYQLMPHAIEILEKDESGLDGTEWGTIIVAVCGDDCVEDSARAGGSGYFEEWVGVQWEEIVKRR